MKNFSTIKFLLPLLSMAWIVPGCKKFLHEDVYSQLAPENYLNTQEGLESVLFASYATTANLATNNSVLVLGPQEYTTDILISAGGDAESTIAQYMNFTFHPALDYLTANWDPPYQSIRNANIILENADKAQVTDALKKLYKAESRFLRAVNYYKLYNFFGPVPIRTSSLQELEIAKATAPEMQQFLESELLAVIPDLPEPGKEPAYGRANSGAARGFLVRLYLNTKQWQKAANMCQEIISSNKYKLFDNYLNLFKVDNERNPEYIWVKPAKASTDRRNANSWLAFAFPPNFTREQKFGIVFSSAWVNFPGHFRILDNFYNSFETGDARKDLIVSSYIDNTGKTVSLLNNNDTRSFKYLPDPQAAGAAHGNDIPDIRYADILLSRAEALNELNGPNQPSLDLINEVRRRAKLGNRQLSDFSAKDELRDYILKERGWEFYSEGQRRTDLIRMDKFVSAALARGRTNAKPFHVLFPIPQVAITANSKLVQNPGY